MSEPSFLIDRILSARSGDGSWGYRPGSASAAEPTALACLALAEWGIGDAVDVDGLDWLVANQRADGNVPTVPNVPSPGWTTAHAILAWHNATLETRNAYSSNIERGSAWLLSVSGRRLKKNPEVFGHDTTLQGWPWVDGTHSWAEPTAYAVLALKVSGYSQHDRVREGIRLLLDRSIPGGGWNYGNSRVLGNTLRPFPATTGIVLAALYGEAHCGQVDEAIGYLKTELTRLRSPMSLAWAMIGLRAWDALPPHIDRAWGEAFRNVQNEPVNVLHDAMLLLAVKGAGVLFANAEAVSNG